MNIATKKLGFIMSLTALFSFIIYTFCFVTILFVNEPFSWTGLQQFIAYETSSVSWLKYVGMGCMIVYVCAFLIITQCVKEGIAKNKKVFASVASVFSTAFCVCVSIGYFVQITSTRLQIQSGSTDGLIQFTQSYNLSAINGINMLGWTIFYGLASLALAVALRKTASTRGLQIAFIVNTVIMFTGFIGYLFNSFIILLFTMNLGLGGAGLFIIICFMSFFKKASI